MWIVAVDALLLFGLLLWSTDIGPEPELAPEVVIEQKRQPKYDNGDLSSTRKLELKKLAKISRAEFMREFAQEASRVGLLECLSPVAPSPFVVSVQARLTKDGKLVDAKWMTVKATKPDCFDEKLKLMRFATLAKTLREDGQDLLWQIEW